MAIVQGAEGLTIRMDTDLPLTGATPSLLVQKPSGATASALGTVATATGTFNLDNRAQQGISEDFESSEYFTVTSASGLFDEAGTYKVQPRITATDNPTALFGPAIDVEVVENLLG